MSRRETALNHWATPAAAPCTSTPTSMASIWARRDLPSGTLLVLLVLLAAGRARDGPGHTISIFHSPIPSDHLLRRSTTSVPQPLLLIEPASSHPLHTYVSVSTTAVLTGHRDQQASALLQHQDVLQVLRSGSPHLSNRLLLSPGRLFLGHSPPSPPSLATRPPLWPISLRPAVYTTPLALYI